MVKILLIAFTSSVVFSFLAVNIIDDKTFGSVSTIVLQDTINPNKIIEATGPEWLDEIPLDIPELEEGTIVSAVCNDPEVQSKWTIVYKDISKAVLSNYRDLLNVNDFKTSEITRKGGSSQFTATQDGIKVICIEKNGTVELTITTKF